MTHQNQISSKFSNDAHIQNKIFDYFSYEILLNSETDKIELSVKLEKEENIQPVSVTVEGDQGTFATEVEIQNQEEIKLQSEDIYISNPLANSTRSAINDYYEMIKSKEYAVFLLTSKVRKYQAYSIEDFYKHLMNNKLILDEKPVMEDTQSSPTHNKKTPKFIIMKYDSKKDIWEPSNLTQSDLDSYLSKQSKSLEKGWLGYLNRIFELENKSF